MKKTKKWDKTECLQFLRKFDAFEHKYLCYKKDIDVSNLMSRWQPPELKNWNTILDSQSHGLSDHNLSHKEEAEAAQGIRQVYRDETHYTNEYLEMINIVRDKFIYDYTGISGLCDFFSPAYFEYEWGMHLEIDYDKHDSRYYRDHYVHQIRNLFEMFTLLDEYGYYEKLYNSYRNPENRIGTFIFEAIAQEILNMNCTDKELYLKAIKLSGVSGVKKVSPPILDNYRDELSNMMFHYIIYSATIIASLVHDIGYPISYIKRIGGSLNKYLPVSQLISNTGKDTSEVKRALQNSLLFKTVPIDRIEARLNDTGEHGAQSAIVLLMYFHLHGENLSYLQRCAIELAALVVYNHTNKYAVIIDEDTDLVRSDMYKEPLSHLFRLCDDLQEWDRVYFEVTDKSNKFICPNCKTPILRKHDTDISRPEQKVYQCCCPRTENDGITYFDTNYFVNRRIINVIGIDKMWVKPLSEAATHVTEFDMIFDCGALLDVMTFSKSYARVRADGIAKTKRLSSYQGASDSVLINAFVSPNPFAVKIQILEECVKNILKDNYTDRWSNEDFDLLSAILESTKIRTIPTVRHIWEINIKFYCWLYRTGEQFQKECKEIIEGLTKVQHKTRDVFEGQWKELIDALSDQCKKKLYTLFDELDTRISKIDGFNTTNKTVLDDYNKIYQILCDAFLKIAQGKLDIVPQRAIRDMLQNEDIYNICCDYLMQQAHKLGYERVRDELNNPKEYLNSEEILRNNIYRRFYEKLYCTDSALSEQVDRYISRAKYDDVKESCYKKNINNYKHIDFFVDYGLFIRLWNKVQERRAFYFDYFGMDGQGDPVELDIPNKPNIRYCTLQHTSEEYTIILECTTERNCFDYDSVYTFNCSIFENTTDKKLAGTGELICSVDLDAHTFKIDYNSFTGYSPSTTMFKAALRQITKHHNVDR